MVIIIMYYILSIKECIKLTSSKRVEGTLWKICLVIILHVFETDNYAHFVIDNI